MKNQANLIAKEATTKQNRIWVRISAACNNICIFCLDSDAQDGKLISEEKVQKEIKQWYKEWVENRIILSWGEASINPKFPEYILYAKKIWYNRVQTVTNGNMFANEKFCKKVFDAWLEEVTFSFHGHTSSLHDYLVATPWAFKKSLKWIIYVKKYYPNIIVNIDIVVNRLNVKFLPDIVKFFMRLWVYEFDILQIIPFWRGFSEYKEQLFYNIPDYKRELLATWKLSKHEWMYMWTNRFPAEAFEWYEDLIQDPRKIKSEVMWEAIEEFSLFIESKWTKKPHCFGERCNYCFLKQYCHDYIASTKKNKLKTTREQKLISWELFPSLVFEKYWNSPASFKAHIKLLAEQYELINIPKCLGWSGKYTNYNNYIEERTVSDYTDNYIKNLYRKKSLRCWACKHNNSCEWIHLNFIRSYGFDILQTVK